MRYSYGSSGAGISTTLVAASWGGSLSPGSNAPVTVTQQKEAAATCEGKIGEMRVNGTLVIDGASFRVTMNSFLATGGDGFTVFNEGTSALGGAVDIDALVEYFEAAEPAGIAVPPLTRITPVP